MLDHGAMSDSGEIADVGRSVDESCGVGSLADLLLRYRRSLCALLLFVAHQQLRGAGGTSRVARMNSSVLVERRHFWIGV